MKLRNKKTGEIGKLLKLQDDDDLEVMTDNKCYRYKTLAEVAEHWEDYEEPKGKYWFMDNCGDIHETPYTGDDLDKNRKLIGNYFETREEAERAVEKLKAWKRLKDKGVRIVKRSHGYYGGEMFWKCPNGTGVSDKQIRKDLDLLFGGEDE